MFQSIDLNLPTGPIKNAWMRLIRQIQTEVEHKRVFNISGAAMAKGDIIYIDDTGGDREADLAQADALATARWAAVVAEPIATASGGIARTDGYALVRFEDDLGALTEGNLCWLSADVAGAASTAAPQVAGYSIVVGIIADAQDYSADNPFAWVILGHCCEPTVNPPI